MALRKFRLSKRCVVWIENGLRSFWWPGEKRTRWLDRHHYIRLQVGKNGGFLLEWLPKPRRFRFVGLGMEL